MRSTRSLFLRVLVLGTALTLLPTTLDRSGLGASSLCAGTGACVGEVGTVCIANLVPQVDHREVL